VGAHRGQLRLLAAAQAAADAAGQPDAISNVLTGFANGAAASSGLVLELISTHFRNLSLPAAQQRYGSVVQRFVAYLSSQQSGRAACAVMREEMRCVPSDKTLRAFIAAEGCGGGAFDGVWAEGVAQYADSCDVEWRGTSWVLHQFRLHGTALAAASPLPPPLLNCCAAPPRCCCCRPPASGACAGAG
jgi:hypothetical protein